jgi:large subunit ribosomal protein L15
MMKIKKRKKASRMHGSHTHGRGFKKKARGKGHRGGKGMSGTGKRADQKKTLILNLKKPYFGKSKTLRAPVRKKLKAISLENLEDSGKTEFNLIGYKILGKTSKKLKIKASAVSKSAQESIKAAAGEITLV